MGECEGYEEGYGDFVEGEYGGGEVGGGLSPHITPTSHPYSHPRMELQFVGLQVILHIFFYDLYD